MYNISQSYNRSEALLATARIVPYTLDGGLPAARQERGYIIIIVMSKCLRSHQTTQSLKYTCTRATGW